MPLSSNYNSSFMSECLRDPPANLKRIFALSDGNGNGTCNDGVSDGKNPTGTTDHIMFAAGKHIENIYPSDMIPTQITPEVLAASNKVTPTVNNKEEVNDRIRWRVQNTRRSFVNRESEQKREREAKINAREAKNKPLLLVLSGSTRSPTSPTRNPKCYKSSLQEESTMRPLNKGMGQTPSLVKSSIKMGTPRKNYSSRRKRAKSTGANSINTAAMSARGQTSSPSKQLHGFDSRRERKCALKVAEISSSRMCLFFQDSDGNTNGGHVNPAYQSTPRLEITGLSGTLSVSGGGLTGTVGSNQGNLSGTVASLNVPSKKCIKNDVILAHQHKDAEGHNRSVMPNMPIKTPRMRKVESMMAAVKTTSRRMESSNRGAFAPSNPTSSLFNKGAEKTLRNGVEKLLTMEEEVKALQQQLCAQCN